MVVKASCGVGRSTHIPTTATARLTMRTCRGMKTSVMLRGSAWWARCLRAARGSMRTPSTRRGRKWSRKTCVVHSVNGSRPRMMAGIPRSHHPQWPAMIRATVAAMANGAMMRGVAYARKVRAASARDMVRLWFSTAALFTERPAFHVEHRRGDCPGHQPDSAQQRLEGSAARAGGVAQAADAVAVLDGGQDSRLGHRRIDMRSRLHA